LESEVVMDLLLGIFLMFGIAMIICIGCIMANGTQQHIDYQNSRLRKHDEWRKNND
jgi:hypothetical protein